MFKLLSIAIVAGLFIESHQEHHSDTSEPHECWTDWFDRDDPPDTGDWEDLRNLRSENPGKICPNPKQIVAKTKCGLTPAKTGDVIHRSDTIKGFICLNSQQPNGKMCNDYKVRFMCEPPYCAKECWTNWYDRDDPAGTGDWETLSDLRRENKDKICENPLQIEAVTVKTMTAATNTGETFHVYNPNRGFACRNEDQQDGACLDYKVRFKCPCKEE
ncbi:uncharacterized protein [Antennarius striatus]|uniref:uncharacterized protein n=1 Tax=Antennarius striatus TaxID=241820 RepID=UPI0035B47A7D